MSRLIIWVSTYLSILIYSAGVGWGKGIKGRCNRGMVGLMRWKKRSQSLIECWISQLCLLLSLASCYTLGHCTHCTKSLSGLWTKTVFSQRLRQLQKAFEQDKRWAATGRAVRSGTGLMSDFYVCLRVLKKMDKRTFSHHQFLTRSFSVGCVSAGHGTKLTTPVSENYALELRPNTSIHFSVFKWI